MKRSLRDTIGALAACLTMAAPEALGQAQRPGQAAPAQTGQAGAPGASARMEILTYDNWTVTCRDGRDPKEKRACSAQLDIHQEANNQRRVVFAWIMGLKDGAPTMALRFLPGVLIAPGVEVRFPEKTPRKIPITMCEPSHCEASAAMDDAFIKDASAVVQGEVGVQASDGRQVTFTINMKGFPQALATIRK